MTAAEQARKDVEECLRPFTVYNHDRKSGIMGVQLPDEQREALIARLTPVYGRAQACGRTPEESLKLKQNVFHDMEYIVDNELHFRAHDGDCIRCRRSHYNDRDGWTKPATRQALADALDFQCKRIADLLARHDEERMGLIRERDSARQGRERLRGEVEALRARPQATSAAPDSGARIPLYLKPGEVCPKCKRPMLQIGADGALWDSSCGVCEETERAEDAEARLTAMQAELEHWRHGVTIEGDFVCPNDLARINAEADVKRLREALQELLDFYDSKRDTIDLGRARAALAESASPTKCTAHPGVVDPDCAGCGRDAKETT